MEPGPCPDTQVVPRGAGTCPSVGLTLSRGLVSTLVCMPAVLPVSFFSALTCTEGQMAWTSPPGPSPKYPPCPVPPLSWYRQQGRGS